MSAGAARGRNGGLPGAGAVPAPASVPAPLPTAKAPPPTLEFRGYGARILQPGERASLECVAPLNVANFELQRRGETLRVPMASSSRDRVFFELDPKAEGDSGPYTCRYLPRGGGAAWSANSAPVELVRSDGEQGQLAERPSRLGLRPGRRCLSPAPAGSLAAPELSAFPPGPRAAPGSLVRLRCRVPGPRLRVALEREDALGRQLLAVLRPAGAEAEFELRNVSVADSANYSCIYTDPAQRFVGSARSARLELRVDGERAVSPALAGAWASG